MINNRPQTIGDHELEVCVNDALWTDLTAAFASGLAAVNGTRCCASIAIGALVTGYHGCSSPCTDNKGSR